MEKKSEMVLKRTGLRVLIRTFFSEKKPTVESGSDDKDDEVVELK